MTDKLPPHEAWDRVIENHLDDEAERVAKLTDEEAAKGVDPKAVRAKGEALAAKLKAAKAAKAATASPEPAAVQPEAIAPPVAPAVAPPDPPEAPVLTLPQRRRSNLLWLAPAVLSAAALVFLVLREPGPSGGPVAIPTAPPPASSVPTGPSPLELASTLRRDAYAACGIKQWDDCQQKLDEAWRLDPTGEHDPRVRGAREAAMKGLLEIEERNTAKRGPK